MERENTQTRPTRRPEEETRAVEVGGQTYTIGRFRGGKATLLMREIARAARTYPDLAGAQAEFEKAYVEEHKLTLSRPEAEIEFGDDAREISDEAWEATGNVYPLRRMPSRSDRLLAILPELLDVAEEHVFRILAIVAATNAELRDADEEDGLEAFLASLERDLKYEGEIEELVELARVGYAIGRRHFEPLEDLAGNLDALLGLGLTGPRRAAPDPSPSSPASSETSPSSSTASPPPTAGPDERPSGPPTSSSDDSEPASASASA